MSISYCEGTAHSLPLVGSPRFADAGADAPAVTNADAESVLLMLIPMMMLMLILMLLLMILMLSPGFPEDADPCQLPLESQTCLTPTPPSPPTRPG